MALIVKQTPADFYDTVTRTLRSFDNTLSVYVARIDAASDIAFKEVRNDLFERTIAVINLLEATVTPRPPGIAQYARDQVDDQLYDVALELDATKTQCLTLRDDIEGFWASGTFQEFTVTNHEFVCVNLSAGQKTALRARLVNIRNTLTTV